MNIIIQFTPVVMVFIMFGIGMNVNKKKFF